LKIKHNLLGKKFGNWTVIKKEKNDKNQIVWLCKCDCIHGTEKVHQTGTLVHGRSLSCGLCATLSGIPSEVFGLSNTRQYSIYNNMKHRCYDEKSKNYDNYGRRGISICDEWLGETGFINFYNWAMENGYCEELTLERKNVNGNYEPENCTWATFEDQCNNRRSNVFVEINGEIKTIAQWTKEYSLPEFTIYQRYKSGIRGEDLISPLKPLADKQSTHKGIRWRNDSKKWEASVTQNKKVKILGCFTSEQDALDIREEYIKENKLYQYKEVN
jgi:hypothetical protein